MTANSGRAAVVGRRSLIAAVLGASGLLDPPGARAAGAQVTIDNFSFSPARLSVVAGTRVTWLNHDDIPHTVMDAATPPLMRSAPLDTGDSFAFTFDKSGTYAYFCSLHPHMQGTVIVQ